MTCEGAICWEQWELGFKLEQSAAMAGFDQFWDVPRRSEAIGNMEQDPFLRLVDKLMRTCPEAPQAEAEAGGRRQRPDPVSAGPATMVWHALNNSLPGDPREVVAWAAGVIADQLALVQPDSHFPMTEGQTSVVIDDACRFLGMISEIFGQGKLKPGDEGALPFKAELKHHRGRPVRGDLVPNTFELRGPCKAVAELIAAGDIQKVAVGKIAQQFGLKDSKVAAAFREYRKAEADWKKRRSKR